MTREDIELEIVATKGAIDSARKILFFNELSLKTLKKELERYPEKRKPLGVG